MMRSAVFLSYLTILSFFSSFTSFNLFGADRPVISSLNSNNGHEEYNQEIVAALDELTLARSEAIVRITGSEEPACSSDLFREKMDQFTRNLELLNSEADFRTSDLSISSKRELLQKLQILIGQYRNYNRSPRPVFSASDMVHFNGAIFDFFKEQHHRTLGKYAHIPLFMATGLFSAMSIFGSVVLGLYDSNICWNVRLATPACATIAPMFGPGIVLTVIGVAGAIPLGIFAGCCCSDKYVVRPLLEAHDQRLAQWDAKTPEEIITECDSKLLVDADLNLLMDSSLFLEIVPHGGP